MRHLARGALLGGLLAAFWPTFESRNGTASWGRGEEFEYDAMVMRTARFGVQLMWWRP